MSDSIQGFNAELKLDFSGVTNAVSALKELNGQIQLAKSGMKGSWGTGGGSRGPAIQQDNSFRDAMKELKNSVALDKLVATTNAKADAVAKKEEARQAQEFGTALKWLSGIALTVGAGLLKLLDVGAKEAHQTVMGAAQLGMNPSQFLRWKQMGKNLIGDENAGPSALTAMNDFTQSVKKLGSLDQQKAILMSTGLGDRLSKNFLDKNAEQQVLELMDAAQAKIKENPNDASSVYWSLNKIFGSTGISDIVAMLNKTQGGESGAAYLKGETGVSTGDLNTLTGFDILKNTTLTNFANALAPFEANLAKLLSPALESFNSWLAGSDFKSVTATFIEAMKTVGNIFTSLSPALFFFAAAIKNLLGWISGFGTLVKTLLSGNVVGAGEFLTKGIAGAFGMDNSENEAAKGYLGVVAEANRKKINAMTPGVDLTSLIENTKAGIIMRET